MEAAVQQSLDPGLADGTLDGCQEGVPFGHDVRIRRHARRIDRVAWYRRSPACRMRRSALPAHRRNRRARHPAAIAPPICASFAFAREPTTVRHIRSEPAIGIIFMLGGAVAAYVKRCKVVSTIKRKRLATTS